MICLYGLFFDAFCELYRRQVILKSLKNDDCPYLIEREEDLEFMREILRIGML